MIEVKFRSGKSSTANYSDRAPTDQLAKEWDNLLQQCEAEDSKPHLIYLTTDYGIPANDLEDSAEEFQYKRPDKLAQFSFRCYWLSWNHLAPAFNGESHPILVDLTKLTTRYGFVFYNGITPFAAKNIEWTFSVSQELTLTFSFDVGALPHLMSPWSFKI